MVESFDRENFLQTSSLNCLSLSVKSGDILIIKFDRNEWDLDAAHAFLKQAQQIIPKEVSILPILNGVELGVINYEN